LGTSPLITLAEWTDVLHLSSKWGFEDLRTASLAAIPPLASPVDKLVLARTYSLTDWISSAYADLLEREEDLTEEEAERMTIKDIVAIAKGRRAIRAPGKVEPRSVIEKAVESLVPSYKDKQRHGSLLVSPIDFVTPPSSVPVAMTQTPDDSHLLVSRWLDQLTLPVLADSAQTCLIKFVLADRARVPLMLDMIMQRCFRAFKSNYQNALSRFSFSQISLPEIDLGQWDARIYNLNQRTPGGMFNGNNTREAALRVIDQWSALRRVCQDGGQRLTVTTSSQEWQDLMNGIMFLCRCCSTPSHSSAIIDRSVFAGFWSTLLMVLMSTAPHQIPSVARLLHALLAELKMRGVQNIKCAEVHWEMDAFYRAVKDARLKAQDAKDSDYVDVVKALDVCSSLELDDNQCADQCLSPYWALVEQRA
jgi:hypothetical protein